MNGPDRLPLRCLLFAELLARPTGGAAANDANRPLLASILAGQASGTGCLPADLGLGAPALAELLATYFPGAELLFTTRPALQIPELEDLQKLLLDHRAGRSPAESWIATVVATACAGSDHLWQDLGFTSRAELSQLMQVNFPELAALNSGDMKWKKFLYRQFCSREGIYVCPAPSCGVCKDFSQCFGPEN